jgi:hypothetical protein
MEQYKRTRGIMEVATCHGVEEYVWWRGALIPLQWLREEYQRRLAISAGTRVNLGSMASDVGSGDVPTTHMRGDL